MQSVLDAVIWVVVDIVLWSVGAAIKKALGRPISESGRSEEAIGLAAILGIVALIVWWARSV